MEEYTAKNIRTLYENHKKFKKENRKKQIMFQIKEAASNGYDSLYLKNIELEREEIDWLRNLGYRIYKEHNLISWEE